MVNRLNNILLLLFLIISAPVSAQFDISIRLFAPQPNHLSQHDVWNFEVVNNMQISIMEANINIKATIERVGYGDIYEGETDMFVAPQGISSYNYNLAKLRNISVSIEESNMKDFYVRYKNLPDGNYRICVKLTLYDPVGVILQQSQDCIFHTIAHPGFIILNYPIDGDTIPSSSFQFMWTHSTADFGYIFTHYELIMAEVLDHQRPEEALMTNPPVHKQKFVYNPYYQYPTFERSLDTGKTYSWQVFAYGNIYTTSKNSWGAVVFPEEYQGKRLLLATSNIEHFVIGDRQSTEKKQVVKKNSPSYYIVLDKSQPNVGLTYFENSVQVSLKNPYADRNLSYTIWNERNVQIGKHQLIPVKKGKNKLDIDLTELNLESKHYYLMELKLSDTEQYSIQLYKR